jgi:hypothetical protein
VTVAACAAIDSSASATAVKMTRGIRFTILNSFLLLLVG